MKGLSFGVSHSILHYQIRLAFHFPAVSDTFLMQKQNFHGINAISHSPGEDTFIQLWDDAIPLHRIDVISYSPGVDAFSSSSGVMLSPYHMIR